MLDLYATCPKCGERLVGAEETCPKCRVAFARKSRARRWIEIGAVAALVVFLAVGTGKPQWLPKAIRWIDAPADANAAPAVRSWAFGGVEPAARAWAAPLEKSLEGACREVHTRFRDPKAIGGFLSPRLTAAEATLTATGKPVWRKATPEEVRDAFDSIGTADSFAGVCLRATYDALTSCGSFAAQLNSAEAAACFTRPVQRVLTIEPWKRCATTAQLPQVRSACEQVAVDLARWDDRRNAPVQ